MLVVLVSVLASSIRVPSFAAIAGDSEALKGKVSGMVWERHGNWHLNGASATLRLGETIPPGGLLTAESETAPQSLVILLPDGQRMLCECYQPQTCAQGFRVPAIPSPPDPSDWRMFVGVRNVLLLRPASAESAFPTVTGRAATAHYVEIVAAINPHGDISISPALSALPPGQYSLSVASDGQKTDPATVQPLNWDAEKVARVRVAGSGVYRIRVSDQSYVPRIVVEVLATTPASSATEGASLKQARETVQGWNRTLGGWDLHDFLRAYLQSRASDTSQ